MCYHYHPYHHSNLEILSHIKRGNLSVRNRLISNYYRYNKNLINLIFVYCGEFNTEVVLTVTHCLNSPIITDFCQFLIIATSYAHQLPQTTHSQFFKFTCSNQKSVKFVNMYTAEMYLFSRCSTLTQLRVNWVIKGI